MIVFCHHTLCRFSCSNVLKIDDLLFHKDYFEVHIKFSKTDQAGNGQYSVLPYKKGRYNPHKLMCLYLQVLDCKSNEVLYLFPPLVWDTSLREWRPKVGAQLSYSAAYAAFKKLLVKFGLNPKFFALHSPRIGGTTSMFQNNVPKRLIDRQGRWKSRKTKYRYARDKVSYFVKQLQRSY